MLRRKDTLVKYHFPVHHPDITAETNRFLKVGERPAEGADHVSWYLDALGTTTERPACEKVCTDEDESAENEPLPAEDNSQQAYEEPFPEKNPTSEEVTRYKSKDVEVNLTTDTVRKHKRKKKAKAKKRLKQVES